VTLKDRIEREEQDLKAMEKNLAEFRKELWQAEYVRKHDKRHKGESMEHWQERKKRNRHRRNKREDIVQAMKRKVLHQRKRIRELKEHRDEVHDQPPPNPDGYAIFDGKTVPEWMVTWLQKSRSAGWRGVVVSGVRTAAHSISLCMGMCGAPSCPGTCAGAASNHNMEPNEGYPAGALDVSDYANFEAIQFRIGSPLRNFLPNDPVHFSVSGR
jgi:hypothetical protein